jgi:hypothetical protein
MKTITLLVLPLILFLSFASSAGVSVESKNYRAPIGEWVIEEEQSGSTVRVRMTITNDHRFSGVSFVDEVLSWTYSGVWKMSGDEFTYIYKESSIPLPENFEDTDIIISVDDFSFKSQSKMKGSIFTYIRVR